MSGENIWLSTTCRLRNGWRQARPHRHNIPSRAPRKIGVEGGERRFESIQLGLRFSFFIHKKIAIYRHKNVKARNDHFVVPSLVFASPTINTTSSARHHLGSARVRRIHIRGSRQSGHFRRSRSRRYKVGVPPRVASTTYRVLGNPRDADHLASMSYQLGLPFSAAFGTEDLSSRFPELFSPGDETQPPWRNPAPGLPPPLFEGGAFLDRGE